MFRDKRPPKVTGPLINEKIPFKSMQVISMGGTNLGVLSRREALNMAEQEGLDLVVVTEDGAGGVPIAKIMDYGKELYAKKKKAAEAKKHQKTVQVKEIKMRPKIGEHDYQTKINHGIQFLKDGKRVKFTIEFRGREMISKDERGQQMFDKIDETLRQHGLQTVTESDQAAGRFWSRIYYTK